MKDNIALMYLTDPDNKKRVITLAIKPEGDTVKYSYAINKPTRFVAYESLSDFQSFVKMKGDVFNKKLGRKIALDRLNMDLCYEIEYDATKETPKRAVLRYLSCCNPKSTLSEAPTFLVRAAKHRYNDDPAYLA